MPVNTIAPMVSRWQSAHMRLFMAISPLVNLNSQWEHPFSLIQSSATLRRLKTSRLLVFSLTHIYIWKFALPKRTPFVFLALFYFFRRRCVNRLYGHGLMSHIFIKVLHGQRGAQWWNSLSLSWG